MEIKKGEWPTALKHIHGGGREQRRSFLKLRGEIVFSAAHIIVTKKALVRITGKKISRLCNGSEYFKCQSNCFSFPKATTEYNGLPKQEDIMHKRKGRIGAM